MLNFHKVILKLYEFKYSNVNIVILITKKNFIRKYLSIELKHEINNVFLVFIKFIILANLFVVCIKQFVKIYI